MVFEVLAKSRLHAVSFSFIVIVMYKMGFAEPFSTLLLSKVHL
jgi:hypothetical protein